MRKEKGDINKVYKHGYYLTFRQFKSWGLKFHNLKMGKQNYDIVLDDRTYGYDSNWINALE